MKEKLKKAIREFLMHWEGDKKACDEVDKIIEEVFRNA